MNKTYKYILKFLDLKSITFETKELLLDYIERKKLPYTHYMVVRIPD
jgi:hypothetical protein